MYNNYVDDYTSMAGGGVHDHHREDYSYTSYQGNVQGLHAVVGAFHFHVMHIGGGGGRKLILFFTRVTSGKLIVMHNAK